MKKETFVVLFLLTSTVSAQSEFFISFRGETALIQYKIDESEKLKVTVPFIQNFYAPLGIKISNLFIVELRPGYILASEYYEGWELGVFFSYLFPNNDFYANAGINFHFNTDTDGDEGFYGDTISLISGGVGYNLGGNVALEISFNYPMKANYGFRGDIDLERNIKYDIKWISKFGVVFRL